MPPRTGAERLVLAVLVLGLALNALVLLRHAALSRSDVLLGATVLLAGITLLVMMEVYRRTG
jgi:fatty acid desaturase